MAQGGLREPEDLTSASKSPFLDDGTDEETVVVTVGPLVGNLLKRIQSNETLLYALASSAT